MWYQTGTVTTVNGSASVLGVGTAWVSQVKIGDILTIDRSTYYKVAAVVSDTELTLASPYLGASAAGQIYAIVLDFNNAAASWLQAAIGLLTPPDRVTSVFSRTGAVIAQDGDYAASQVTVAPDSPLKALDVQAALDELAVEKAPLLSPDFAGTPTAPTPETGDSSDKLATTAFVKAQGYITAAEAPVLSVAGKTGVVTLEVADVAGAAPLASPELTGTPTAPTAATETNSTQLATTAFVKAQPLNDLAAPTAALSINDQRLIHVADPTDAQDAATKAYVDAVAQGLDAKASVRAATTADITLSGTQTIDGVALAAGDRVLVKDLAAPAENGIYVVAAGAWARSADADTWDELVSAYVFVEDGTVNANAGFTCTVQPGGTLGTTPVTWVQFSGAGQVIAGTGLLKAGNTLSVDTSVIAALASPDLTGTPTAPTAAAGTNSTQLATTAFVKAQGYITAAEAPVLSVAGKTGVVTLVVADVAGAAPLASPALTGTPIAPTAAVDTNTMQLATTAFVVGQGYLKSIAAAATYAPLISPTFSGVPVISGTAPELRFRETDQTLPAGLWRWIASGNEFLLQKNTAAAGDFSTATTPLWVNTAGNAVSVTHFVATGNTILGNAAGDTVTVNGMTTFVAAPNAPTAAVDTNTTQIATTAFVVGQASAPADGNPAMNGTAARGASTHYARADHVHPTDTSRAPLASPALTGTPTAPTPALGTNSTQLATTAFVLAQVNAGGGMSWQTKAANFTAAGATGYFIDTSGGAVTATLPASPAVGDQVRLVDVASSFALHNLTVARAGQQIMGLDEDMTVSNTYATVHLVYSGAAEGWRLLF